VSLSLEENTILTREVFAKVCGGVCDDWAFSSYGQEEPKLLAWGRLGGGLKLVQLEFRKTNLLIKKRD
jgi:hypothetical protein